MTAKKKMVILECTECGHRDERREWDPYTGHMYDSNYTYTCHECRGDMIDVTHLKGAVCLCDAALKDIDYNKLSPWKVWIRRENI